MGAVEQLRERMMVCIRMLAHIERREVEPEGGDHADGGLEPSARNQLAAVGEQRVA